MNKGIALISIIFLLVSPQLLAQSDYGIKAGLSYNSNGKLSEIVDETETILDNKGKGKSGFNLGFYGKLDLGPIYLRPELVYTKTTTEYNLGNEMEDYKISKIDIPVLVGVDLIGPLSVFAGPAFQYVLSNDLKGLSFNSIEKEFTVGMNIGASVKLGRFGFDVRYERGFNDSEADVIDSNIQGATVGYRLDSRPKQLIFSLSYSLVNRNKI
jgi:hypothetical protein